jgi:hypothetical protein
MGYLEAQILMARGRCGPAVTGVSTPIGTACRLGRDAAHREADSIAAAVTMGAGEFALAFWLASYYAASGDREATLRWLERSLEERTFFGVVASMPLFAFVRDEPRFQALLRAAHIPPSAPER